MHTFEWLIATNPNIKGISRKDRAELIAIRNRVCAKANTKTTNLNNAFYRGSIGRNLVERMVSATKDEQLKITLIDHLKEID